MSDDPLDLVRPEPPRSWREQASAFAESLDVSPRRLAVACGALVLAGLVAWRLLAPADPAPEMELPFASTASSAVEGAHSGSGAGAGGEAPAVPAASPGPSGPSGSGGPAAVSGSTVPTEVVVHVAGAVARPGVQRLPGGSRVVDAVDAAGGANPDADLARVNLAVPVQDGQQVYVPRVGEVPPTPIGGTSASPSGPPSGAGAPSDGSPSQPVNINTASADELDTLPGVGPATAEAIIAYRDQSGPFTSVDQLLDVRGIGDAKLAQLRDLVTI